MGISALFVRDSRSPTYSRHSHPNAVQCRRATLALATPTRFKECRRGNLPTLLSPLQWPGQAVRLADPYHAQSHGSLCLLYLFYHLSHTHPVPFPPLLYLTLTVATSTYHTFSHITGTHTSRAQSWPPPYLTTYLLGIPHPAGFLVTARFSHWCGLAKLAALPAPRHSLTSGAPA